MEPNHLRVDWRHTLPVMDKVRICVMDTSTHSCRQIMTEWVIQGTVSGYLFVALLLTGLIRDYTNHVLTSGCCLFLIAPIGRIIFLELGSCLEFIIM